MKRRIFAALAAVMLVLAAVPVYAGDICSIDSNVVGTAVNPLIVSGGSDGIKYISLGDSIAYGYGLNDNMNTYLGLETIENSYPDLINKYLESNNYCSDSNFYQGAVCGERIVDLCHFFKPNEYPMDATHQIFRDTYLAYTVTGSDGETQYDYSLYESYKKNMPEHVKNADFITITAGGNDTIPFLFQAQSDPSKYITTEDMNILFGESAASAYNFAKNSLRAKAKMIDAIKGNKIDEETGKAATEESLEKVLGIVDILLYLNIGYIKGEEDILDIIHEINPGAVIAITGLPSLLKGYKFKVSDSLTVDMDKLITPMIKVLNDVIKNAAEERSSYVRYIDIFEAETLPILNKDSQGEDYIYGKEIDSDYIDDFISVNVMRISHPSENGHVYIANEIVKNFKFLAICENAANIGNKINNITATVSGKTGITKLSNFMTTVKSIDFPAFIKNSGSVYSILEILY